MREVKVGSRIIYEHEEGGLNALITAIGDPSVRAVSLVYVLPDGTVESKKDLPNTYFAMEEKDVPRLVGPQGARKLETAKEMCSIANGHWRA